MAVGAGDGVSALPVIRLKVVDVHLWQDVLHLGYLRQSKKIDLHKPGFVQQDCPVFQLERNKVPFVAKHVQNPLVLADMEAAEVLAARLQSGFDRDEVFGIFHVQGLHFQMPIVKGCDMANMQDRKRAEDAARSIPDPEAFRDACAVFGEADALARLHMFRTELATQLAGIQQGQPEPEPLRQIAHRTAGRAGLFGFSGLAEASAQLEDAIRNGTDTTTALALWTELAQHAAQTETNTAASGRSG